MSTCHQNYNSLMLISAQIVNLYKGILFLFKEFLRIASIANRQHGF